MRFFDSTTPETTTVGVVDVARWEQFGLGATMPFQAMWYTVPPASCSPRDCHPELELSIVLAGRAEVQAADAPPAIVEQGSAFLLESDEAHIVHNRSADTDLVIFSAYWMPVQSLAASAVSASASAVAVDV